MTGQEKNIFDAYAADYDVTLARRISVSGEDKNYFARRRVEWLGSCLSEYLVQLRWVMDYGCGTGSSTPFIVETFPVEYLIGTDQSPAFLEIARDTHGSQRAEFKAFRDCSPNADFDLVFCNGVFHHVPPDDRRAAIEYVFQSLRPGGFFAFGKILRRIPGLVM